MAYQPGMWMRLPVNGGSPLYFRRAVHSHAAQSETPMTLLRISLVVMCLTKLNLLGQTVQFVDDSPSGSPVSFQGTITFPANPDEATCEVTGHNNSPKAIVAYMLEVHFTKPTGETETGYWTIDRFFKQGNIAAPQADFPVMAFCDSGHSLNGSPKPAAPAAKISALFIQYEDSSVWGDDKAVAEAMFQRTETLKYLKSLRDAYSDGGDYALYQALRAPQATNPDHRHRFMASGIRQRLLKLDSARAAADRIDEDLATAEEHVAWLK